MLILRILLQKLQDMASKSLLRKSFRGIQSVIAQEGYLSEAGTLAHIDKMKSVDQDIRKPDGPKQTIGFSILHPSLL